MIVKIQEEGNPMSHIFFSVFAINVDDEGKIIVWSTDIDNKSHREEFKPSSYQIVIEKDNDAKKFYKKHM